MPTLEVTVSETTYSSLRETAEKQERPIEFVVQNALDAFFNAAPPITSESNAISNQRTRRQATIHAEAQAWRALPEQRRTSYGNVFVAVHRGEVVDADPDRLTLFRRIRARFGDEPVLITPAQADLPRTFQIHSPHVARPS